MIRTKGVRGNVRKVFTREVLKYILSMEKIMRATKGTMNNYMLLVLLVLVCAGCRALAQRHEAPGSTAVPTFDPPYSIQTPLPGSLKGYELYSWIEDDTRLYTLITGTNRTKDIREITSSENLVTADGWVKISVQDGDRPIKCVNRLS